jgi:hypothetical protein
MAVRLEHEWLKQSWRKHKTLADQLDLDEQQRRLFEIRWFEEAKHHDDVWRPRRRLDTPKWSFAAAGFLAAIGAALEGFFDFRTAMAPAAPHGRGRQERGPQIHRIAPAV